MQPLGVGLPPPTVEHDHLPCHETGMRGRKEGDHRCDVVRLAEASHGIPVAIFLPPAIIGVRMLRGATTFAVIPCPQYSREIAFVNVFTARLDVA